MKTLSPNSSTTASAPPAPAAATKTAFHFTKDTLLCAIPPLPLLLNHLTPSLARLLLPRRLRQIQSPPPPYPPRGQPPRATRRSRLHPQRRRIRHQRRPILRYRPARQRRRPGGRESQHCGVGVRECAAKRGVTGGLVQFACFDYSVYLCMRLVIRGVLFPRRTSADGKQGMDFTR